MPVAVAFGTVTVDGAGVAVVPIVGTAPGIIPAPWAVTAGENAATITSFPAAPVEPNWSIEAVEDVVVVYGFPRALIQADAVVNVEVTGSAIARGTVSVRRVSDPTGSANGGTLIPFRS